MDAHKMATVQGRIVIRPEDMVILRPCWISSSEIVEDASDLIDIEIFGGLRIGLSDKVRAPIG